MLYYDNKEEHGKIIDWKMIFKEYRKLLRGAKVSDPIYDPTTAPVYDAKFFQLLSERSSGKTTGWLLIGMLLNKHYGKRQKLFSSVRGQRWIMTDILRSVMIKK